MEPDEDIMKPKTPAKHAGPALLVHCLLLLLLVAFVAIGWRPAWAELHEGDGYLHMGDEGGWDFSTFSYVHTLDVDLFIGIVAVDARSEGAVTVGYLGGSGLQFAPSNVEFDSLAAAPDSGYVDLVTALQWQSYYVRTREGHYAKIQLTTFDGYTQDFHYVYQDDGSTVLPIHPTSWGRVKALYRQPR